MKLLAKQRLFDRVFPDCPVKTAECGRQVVSINAVNLNRAAYGGTRTDRTLVAVRYLALPQHLIINGGVIVDRNSGQRGHFHSVNNIALPYAAPPGKADLRVGAMVDWTNAPEDLIQTASK